MLASGGCGPIVLSPVDCLFALIKQQTRRGHLEKDLPVKQYAIQHAKRWVFSSGEFEGKRKRKSMHEHHHPIHCWRSAALTELCPPGCPETIIQSSHWEQQENGNRGQDVWLNNRTGCYYCVVSRRWTFHRDCGSVTFSAVISRFFIFLKCNSFLPKTYGNWDTSGAAHIF